MSSVLGKLWTRFSNKRTSISIMLVGLDNSGKSCILSSLVSSPTPDRSCGHDEDQSTSTSSKKTRRQTSDENEVDFYQNPEDLSAQLFSIDPGNEDPTVSFPQSTTESRNLASNDSNYRRDSGVRGGCNIMPTIGYNYERIQFRNSTLTVLDFSGQSKYRNLWQEFYSSVDAIVFVIDSSDMIRFVVARDELETLLNHPYFSTLQQQSTNNQIQISPSLASNSQPVSATGAQSLCQKVITISQGRLIQRPLQSPPGASSVGCKKQASTNLGRKSSSSIRRMRLRTKIPILFLANKSDLVGSADTNTVAQALGLEKLPSGRHPWTMRSTSTKSSQGIREAFDWLVDQVVTNIEDRKESS